MVSISKGERSSVKEGLRNSIGEKIPGKWSCSYVLWIRVWWLCTAM